MTLVGMSEMGVRRGKAALFQWVQIPPGHRSSGKGAVMEVTKWLKPPIPTAAEFDNGHPYCYRPQQYQEFVLGR